MNKIQYRKLTLILTYLITSMVALVGYLFMVALQKEGYDSEVYKKAYLYLVTFGFIVFNILLLFWEDINWFNKKRKDSMVVEIVFEYYGSLLMEIIMFSLAAAPLILTVFIAGNLNQVNFILPLLIQATWGMAVLSLRGYLGTIKWNQIWGRFLTAMFTFTILFLTLIFLYFYIQYKSLVITTVYDNDIPLIFFINPLLSIVGLLYMQIGGAAYTGYFPVIYTIGFCMLIFILSSLLTIKRLSRTWGGVKNAKASSRYNIEKASCKNMDE